MRKTTKEKKLFIWFLHLIERSDIQNKVSLEINTTLLIQLIGFYIRNEGDCLEAFYIQERIPFFGRITLSQPSLKIHSFGVLEDKQIPLKNLQRNALTLNNLRKNAFHTKTFKDHPQLYFHRNPENSSRMR